MVMSSTRPDYRLHDVRIRERLLAEGVITEKDIKAYMKDLPDVAGEAEFSEVRLHEDEEKEG